MNPIESHRMYRDITREQAETLLRSRAVHGPVFRKSSLPLPQLYVVSYYDKDGTGANGGRIIRITHTLLNIQPDNKVAIVDDRRRELQIFNSIEDVYNVARSNNPEAYPIANNEDPKPVIHNARRRRQVGSRKRKNTQRNRRRKTRRYVY
jgi:hypothetical protein